MRIIKVGRINALGKKGPEAAPNLILDELWRFLGVRSQIPNNDAPAHPSPNRESGNSLATKSIPFLDVEEIHVDNDDVEESEKLIYENSKEGFEVCDRVVFVGGDHSISYPIIKAFMDVNNRSQIPGNKSQLAPRSEDNKNSSDLNARPPTQDRESGNSKVRNFDLENKFLIVFDAHADCDNCAKNPTHEEWLRAVIEEGFKGKNIVLVGVRKMWDVERGFLRKHGVKVFSGDFNLESAADWITERARDMEVYVSVDIDVIDPAFAPGVTYPEVEGLTVKEFFYLLRRIFHLPKIRGLDVVEVVPEKDRDGLTVKTAAKVLFEFLGM